MNAWAAGVDGIYTFNFFDPKSSLWREIGDPATMRPLERMYCTGARGVNVIRSWMAGGERFLNRAPLSPERPRPLKPGRSEHIKLRVGEDIRTVGKVKVTLELQMQPPIEPEALRVRFNGFPLPAGVRSKSWLQFGVDPANVKQGVNHIQIALSAHSSSGEPSILHDLVLWVRPGTSR